MSEDIPDITLWDSQFNEIGYIGNPVSITGSLQHNAIGSMTITLPTFHPLSSSMCAASRRITVNYRGEQIFSGPLRSFEMNAGTDDALSSATFEDDYRLMARTLAWPDPTARLTGTPSAIASRRVADVQTGPAETVLKHYLTANLARFQQVVPIIVAPDRGRGAVITASCRFDTIADKVMPLVDQAGLGVDVRQVDGGLLVDVYEAGAYPDVLTDGRNGVVQSWKASTTAGTATYWVAGWTGEGASQLFRDFRDTGRESLWSDTIETYLDASGAQTAADVDAAIRQAVLGTHEQSGMSIVLNANGVYSYGGPTGLRKGQMVTVQAAGMLHSDILRQVNISWDSTSGWNITPSIGDINGSTSAQLFRTVLSIARRLRAIGK